MADAWNPRSGEVEADRSVKIAGKPAFLSTSSRPVWGLVLKRVDKNNIIDNFTLIAS